jgi:hypothetical protein
MILTTKRCRKCENEKPLESFREHRGGTPQSYRENTCKSCSGQAAISRAKQRYHTDPAFRKRNHANTKAWRSKKPHSAIKISRRSYAKLSYGMTLAQFEEARTKPCEVCGSAEEPVIDHDHGSSAVRGTLCNRCNKALGFAGDNPAILERMALYLIKHPHTPTRQPI